MSELTPCNFCSWRKIKKAYGEGNLKLVPAKGRLGGIEVLVREGEGWAEEPIAWSMCLTVHCVC
jgi:hypothetical protein